MAVRQPGAPYEVGKYRPPIHSRWKPGQSGNPKGRPKGKPDLYTELQSVLLSKVSIGGDGAISTITIQEALVRKVRQMALDGNAAMQRIVLKLEELAPDPAKNKPADPHENDLLAYKAWLIFNNVYEAETGVKDTGLGGDHVAT